jgi:hypothetical protein
MEMESKIVKMLVQMYLFIATTSQILMEMGLLEKMMLVQTLLV